MTNKTNTHINVGESKYWCEKSGAGDPIILLHGFTGSTDTWTSFVSQLDTSFQVIAIDLPGHGKTCVSEPKSMEDCCHDLKKIIDQLGYKKIHLLGYSMGGRTALSFAMMYPELINMLVLESASPGLENENDAYERAAKDKRLSERLQNDGLESFVEFWENIPLFDTQKKLPLSTRQKIKQERLSQKAEGLAMSLTSMGTGVQPSWWDRLETFTSPVLLLAGEADHKFININKQMSNRLPNSNLVIVKNAGHAIHVEESEIFGKIVSEFLLDQTT
ncbi:2-succinyl-6-hydroxy-2,4-cyclohexadiene-1-carboxylate synthase [Virgibacillus flavescens]|uniref:2-succinyl-6-hydroxy-2, 4-cyclohexadiene-1-carboxylate synthase n=1 Tax=Virgibacillus flavescens TaxID=1611422 RepID=UPI003D34C0DD